MGRKGVISNRATVYSKTERKRATQIAARSTAPPHPPPLLEPCANELFRVPFDQFVKGVAEGCFTKHNRGSLHFLALSFIKKKFGTQIEIDGGTSYFFLGFSRVAHQIL